MGWGAGCGVQGGRGGGVVWVRGGGWCAPAEAGRGKVSALCRELSMCAARLGCSKVKTGWGAARRWHLRRGVGGVKEGQGSGSGGKGGDQLVTCRQKCPIKAVAMNE